MLSPGAHISPVGTRNGVIKPTTEVKSCHNASRSRPPDIAAPKCGENPMQLGLRVRQPSRSHVCSLRICAHKGLRTLGRRSGSPIVHHTRHRRDTGWSRSWLQHTQSNQRHRCFAGSITRRSACSGLNWYCQVVGMAGVAE